MDALGRMNKLKDKKGIALVYIALMLVVIMAFVGLAIDIGYMYVAKGQLQNASDAAALAGVSQLPIDTAVITEAKKFAASNKAAGESVTITDSDISLGYWDGKNFTTPTPTTKPTNAVKVVARRDVAGATAANQGRVHVFFGNVLALLPGGGTGWPEMGASASAIASRPPKPTAPIVLCQDLCSKSGPFRVYFNQTLSVDPSGTPNPAYTVGWTEFSATTKATDLGPNSDVAKLIDGRSNIPMGLCDKTLWTNNGLGQAIKVLQDTFIRDRNPTSGKWTILVPIFEYCPSSVSSGERYTTLTKYAEIVISDVKIPGGGSGESYVVIDSIGCEPCATTSFLGDKPSLVK